ncbi:hypothetical protein TUBRATIS_18260 [Tubulinosema ratisbonensis]|uniref:Uncharacterized protein n=1 Tax=Tubulinosema ratisbonensis TaxID=291195 RepID=A0A437AKM0_9MICR|nr:hypothetical protein TUBRATIS_18260 [Tubulinosema ratisbonensis]
MYGKDTIKELKLKNIKELESNLRFINLNEPVLISKDENSSDFFGKDICNEFERLNETNKLANLYFLFEAEVYSKNEEIGNYSEIKNVLIKSIDRNKYEVIDYKKQPEKFCKEDLLTKTPVLVFTHVEKEAISKDNNDILKFKGGFTDILTGGVDLEIEIEEIIILKFD